jgi:hypothetical protein
MEIIFGKIKKLQGYPGQNAAADKNKKGEGNTPFTLL